MEETPRSPLPSQVGLFPLPNVVLFPFTMLKLHVFEPRYRQMLKESLDGEKAICMGFLKPGWESDYYGNPEVFPIACVGQIHEVESLPDGRSNITLLGLARVQILECVQDQPFRRVRIRVAPDVYREEGEVEEREVARKVIAASSLLVETLGEKPVDFAAGPPLPPGALVDRAAGLFQLGVEEKFAILQETRVVERGEILLGFLRSRIQIARQTRSLSGFEGDVSPN